MWLIFIIWCKPQLFYFAIRWTIYPQVLFDLGLILILINIQRSLKHTIFKTSFTASIILMSVILNWTRRNMHLLFSSDVLTVIDYRSFFAIYYYFQLFLFNFGRRYKWHGEMTRYKRKRWLIINFAYRNLLLFLLY